MNLELQQKIVIVTGGASGIGESIALGLAAEGAVVCIIDRNRDALTKVAKDIEEKGGGVYPVCADLMQPEACRKAVTAILEKFNRIDGLVNNAGLNDGVGLENGGYLSFLESLDKNVVHYMNMVDLVLPALKKSVGVIVNICSKTAETGQGGTSGYAAANGIRLALTRTWNEKYRPYGIRVNAVVVAECWTPQYEWWIRRQPDPRAVLKEINSKIPLGNRMTTPGEIAATVLFLLSEKANALNGQFYHVDGGYVHLDRSTGAIVSQ